MGVGIPFADPDFDDEPVQIYEPAEGDPVTPPDDVSPLQDAGDEPLPPEPGEDETIVAGLPGYHPVVWHS